MEIKVTYRPKNSGISMRITKGGDISVSAPLGVTRQEVMRFIENNTEWIERARLQRQESNRRSDDFFGRLPLSTPSDRRKAIAELNTIIPPLIARYEPIMGVRVQGVTYKAMRSRWGSCNTRTRHINFSVYLLLLPAWCIEHIVVHEMAHILVPNHSPAFYAVMDRHYPRWREARAATQRLTRQ